VARQSSAGAGAALAFNRVSKRFGSVTALDEVSFEVARGEFLSLLGPSGSGKSTVQRLIGGFERPDAGEIRMHGKSVQHLPAYLRDTATVFQSGALFPHLSIFDNVAYGLKARDTASAEIEARVLRMLDIVRLGDLAARFPAQLSGGQKQRVALARALVVEPAIVLFDEPLSALDLGLRLELRSEIKALHDTLAFASVYVTHDQSEAMAMSDRIAILNHGRIEQIDTPEVIFREPASEFVFRFLGEFCFLPATADGGDLRLDIDTIHPARHAGAVRSGPARLYFRPQWLKLGRDAQSCETQIEARFKFREFLGESYRYHVEVGDSVLKADHPAVLDLQPGEAIPLGWNSKEAVVYQ
jgi:ABC-type Fe3+/spermidine/putrescine transport system ATPase subunit